MTIVYLLCAIIVGSALSLVGGALLLKAKKQRQRALLLTLPLGAGALLAAAFFDLLPESFERGEPRMMLLWALMGFITFFVLERCATWFHHHHEHSHDDAKNKGQRRLIVAGDIMHNAIDGIAIGAAFLVSIPTGIITTLAVSAHEIPKELGTFAMLMSRGWKDSTVLIANILTAVATIVTAVFVYVVGSDVGLPIGPLLAVTAGCFIYVASSDIIPDIHEQPRRIGTIQAAVLVASVVLVGSVITLLGV